MDVPLPRGLSVLRVRYLLVGAGQCHGGRHGETGHHDAQCAQGHTSGWISGWPHYACHVSTTSRAAGCYLHSL
jgi:hypothetical protein